MNNGGLTSVCDTIRNGDEISVDTYSLKFIIQFAKVGQHRKTGFAAYFSTFLIVSLLILQAGVIVILPKKVAERQLWGLEVMRQRTIALLDVLRHRSQTPSNSIDDKFRQEMTKLIRVELDRIAIYLRKHISNLDLSRVVEFHNDLSYLEELLNGIDNKTLYPQLPTINAEQYLRDMIENSVVGEN